LLLDHHLAKAALLHGAKIVAIVRAGQGALHASARVTPEFPMRRATPWSEMKIAIALLAMFPALVRADGIAADYLSRPFLMR
jgi:hypothetical protein